MEEFNLSQPQLADEVRQLKAIIDQSASAAPVLWRLLLECSEIARNSAVPPSKGVASGVRILSKSTTDQDLSLGETA